MIGTVIAICLLHVAGWFVPMDNPAHQVAQDRIADLIDRLSVIFRSDPA